MCHTFNCLQKQSASKMLSFFQNKTMKDVHYMSQSLSQTSKLIYQISENITSEFQMPFEFSDIQMEA
jgi:hypothetical protein